MNVESPLAKKLLKVTFSLYFIVALTVTALHVVAEYLQSYDRIHHEMQVVLQSNQINLSRALWDYDMEQVRAISHGLLSFSFIEGVRINNLVGDSIEEVGLLSDKDNQAYKIDLKGGKKAVKVNSVLFSVSSRIIYRIANQHESLGEVILFSSEGAVVKQVKLGFYFIVGNAIIKTLALWLIIHFVFSRLITQPLAVATEFIERIDLNDLKGKNANWHIQEKNEIKLLENAFNNMLNNHKEKELNETRRLNKELKKYLSSLVDSMPSILIGLNDNDCITLWNKQAEKESNIKSHQAVGKFLIEFYDVFNFNIQKINHCRINNSVLKDEKVQLLSGSDKRVFDITYYPLTHDNTQGVVLRMDDVTQKVAYLELTQKDQKREVREQAQLQYQGQIEHSNKQLQSTIEDLQKTQQQLVLAEKMASMGRLVTGVAHEINTPLGNAVLGTSALADDIKGIEAKFFSQTMTKQEFKKSLNGISELLKVVTTSLSKAANLVQTFKLVSVDQQKFSKNNFNAYENILLLVESFNSKLIAQDVVINIKGNKEIMVTSYPDALNQVLNQLLNNSLIHGFKSHEKGTITFEISLEGKNCNIKYSDNGQGISEAHSDQIFDPFFTTDRGQGCIGLGLHVVFNLVQYVLKGDIKYQSSPVKGSQFLIKIPIDIEAK